MVQFASNIPNKEESEARFLSGSALFRPGSAAICNRSPDQSPKIFLYITANTHGNPLVFIHYIPDTQKHICKKQNRKYRIDPVIQHFITVKHPLRIYFMKNTVYTKSAKYYGHLCSQEILFSSFYNIFIFIHDYY